MSVSLGLPECVMTWHLASSRGKCPREQGSSYSDFYHLASEATHHFHNILWKYISVLSTWKGATQGHQYHEVDIPVGHVGGQLPQQPKDLFRI